MKHALTTRLVAMGLALAASACTMKNQDPPPLAGPSEFGTAISISATPDVLSQDGASQSVITITARDSNGQPIRNLSLRTEISINGITADFGSLSARTVATGNDGRATVVYTAPTSVANTPDMNTVVDILVTPAGSDFNNAQARTAAIRLVPPSTVPPPAGLEPSFTFTPANPLESQNVFFDASASTSPSFNPITAFSWDFGDGGAGSGETTTHSYRTPGTYFARLTVRDSFGRTASTTRTITVGQATAPTAAFVVSPTNPSVGTTINFNGSASRAAAGRTLVSYKWDFGDGTIVTTGGPTVQHAYTSPRTYTVTLLVTDDIGRTATLSTTLIVTP